MAYKQLPNIPPLKKADREQELTHKQQAFVQEYLVDLNASQACLRAGYKTKNPNRMGTELLHHPKVRLLIEQEMAKRKERMEFSADFLLAKLMSIINDDDVRTSDTLRAIELAGKSIALWKERQEMSGPDGGAIQMEMEQRLKEDVASFTSAISRLARRSGEGEVVEFPNGQGEG